MTAMIARADGHDFRIQPREESVKGSEAGAICETRCLKEGGEDSLEAGCVGRCDAGVDVGVGGDGAAGREGGKVNVFDGTELGGVGGVAEGGSNVDGRCYIGNVVDRVVGVDAEGGERWGRHGCGRGIDGRMREEEMSK